MMKAGRLNDEMITRFTQPRIWRGELLDSHLRDYAATNPDAVAVVDRGRVWTAAELDRRIDQAAKAFWSLGVSAGDVVSWQLPNWIDAVVAHYGAIRIGAVSNPIVPIYRAAEVGFILKQARSKVLLIPQEFRGFSYPAMAAELVPGLPDLATVLVVDGTGGKGRFRDAASFFDSFSGELPPVERDANDVCLLLYTSGTTAAAKGVMHTHNTLCYENQSMINFFGLDQHDIVFMPSPLAHITGILYGVHLPFMLKSSVVLQDTWEPSRGLELIQEHRCGFMLAATPFLYGLVDHPQRDEYDLSSLRIFACGGADVPPELVRRAAESLNCHVARVYGSTEFPTATCCNATDPVVKCADTDGRAMGLAEIQILGDDGAQLPAGQIGEIHVRGPELYLGYLDSALDSSAFDADGFFATGDLGLLDEDGYLTVVGRKKDIIIRGGENLSAKEVEDHLFGYDEIADVAIVGVPDRMLGERVAAFVVPREGVHLELDDLTAWLRNRNIALQKLPELLVVIDELPRTASGKVQKFKLREALKDKEGSRGTITAVGPASDCRLGSP